MLGLLDIDPAAAAPSWRVNPATVSKAYQLLVADGALEVRRGEGTFVADRTPAALEVERERLLGEAAGRFAAAARGMGVARRDAIAAISAAWREIDDAADGGDG